MTTAVYNRQSLGQSASILSLSPIDVRIESEASPKEIAQFLFSLATYITALESVEPEDSMYHEPKNAVNWTADDYRANKYGDDYACCDALGFERSYMGSRADFNHIF